MVDGGVPVLPPVVASINSVIGSAFRAANDKRARSQQKALGMSELGGCRRQAGLKVRGVPESNPRNERTDVFADGREAMVGTLIHDLVLPQIEEMSPTAVIERPVVLRLEGLPEIPGSADMVDGDVLIDLKTLGNSSIGWLQSRGPSKKHIWQTHGYAQALRDAGHHIEHIALVYVDRANGQVVHVHYQQFDPSVVEAIRGWWSEVNGVEDPMMLPRDEHGPGLSRLCDWCPWLKACWGESAVPGATGVQSRVLEEVPEGRRAAEVERLLQTYHAANVAEREAKAEKSFAREALSEVPSGTYGSMVLKWGGGSTFQVLDSDAAVESLTAAGLPVPMVERARQGAITVRPAPRR